MHEMPVNETPANQHGADGVLTSETMLEVQPQPERFAREPDGRLSIQARAKLNLGLRVFPARPDGFHDIESWFVAVNWHDTLYVSAAEELRITITGRSEGVPTDPTKNLIGKAALKLAEHAGIAARAHLELHKVLPPGGGLGGGSSDAAATLVVLNELWGLHWDDRKLKAIAAELGSDVPFFVHGRASLCTGRGEVMTAMRSYHTLFAVLILPPFGCGTKDVYQAFDAGHRHDPALPKTNWCEFASSDAARLNGLLLNDLELAAFAVEPRLRALRDRAAAAIGQNVHMSGSGSTLFTLASSAPASADIQNKLNAALNGDAAVVPVRILRHR